MCQAIAALGFLATVGFLVTAALAYRDIVVCLGIAAVAYLDILAAAYQVTVEHLAIAALANQDILVCPVTQDWASAVIQVNLDTVV